MAKIWGEGLGRVFFYPLPEDHVYKMHQKLMARFGNKIPVASVAILFFCPQYSEKVQQAITVILPYIIFPLKWL